ncbi:MAG: hypothetical protein P0Y53_17140 [Candidatus Pseudobacter hemicellulosilyticus]|uniref:Lipoprotein n=1 Tax=Candidatus Pseudobacter hemicellulosilyticus TaxID=3121375 RepID=A0AAJ5WTJ8_9BACT|nr:MAG: hypothetical protein P0Y53_17140 [Pseudobacter sp.]
MKKFVVAALVSLSFLTGCGGGSAFNFNQTIIQKEESLVKDLESTEAKVLEYVKNDHYDSIAIAGGRMEKLIEEKLQEIRELPAPDAKGAEAFKTSAINYFVFIKQVYTGYRQVGEAKDEDQRAEEWAALMELVGKRQEVLDKMQRSQKAFASANGFRVQ